MTIPTLPASPASHLQNPLIMSGSNNPCITDGDCLSPTNFPEFIDHAACLCGLLPSQQEDPNGGYIELWRCIGNASDDLRAGHNGKWYNTTLPSQELVGINMPQNWGENGPNPDQAYVVVKQDGGKLAYEKLDDGKGSPSLVGPDVDCTAKNDTGLSKQFYAHSGGKKAAAKSMSSSLSSASSVASSTSSAASQSVASASSSSASVATASTSTSATASPSASGTSDAGHASVKILFVFCMLLAPLFAAVA